MREPSALPLTKKSRIQEEVSESSHTSSQKDVLAEKAQKQSLDMSSQQGMSIEIRQSAMASERVSPPQMPTNVNPKREVAHTQKELTETGESSILRIASSVISPSKDTLPSQVLGEGAVITADQSTAPTSPGKTHPDASADSGADIGAVRQPIAMNQIYLMSLRGK